jgi:hypothetical protein
MDIISSLAKHPNFAPRGNIVNYSSAQPVRVDAPQQLVRSERHNSISSIGPPSQVSADTVALNAKPIAYTDRSGASQHKFRIAPYTAPVAAGKKSASTQQVDVPALVAGAKGGDVNPCFALGTFSPSRLGRDRISLLYFPKKPQAPIPGGGFLEKVGNGYVHFHHYRGTVRDTKFADAVELRESGAGTTLKQLAYNKLRNNQTVLMLVPGSGLIPVTVGSVKNRFLEQEDGKRGGFLGLNIALIVSKSFSELTKDEFSKRPVLFDIHELASPEPEFPFDFSTRTHVEDSKLPPTDTSDPSSVRLHLGRPTAASAKPTPVPTEGDELTQQLDAMPMPAGNLNPPSASKSQAPKKPALVLAGAAGTPQAQLKPRANALVPGQTFNSIPTNAFAENPYIGRDTQRPSTITRSDDQDTFAPSAPPADAEPPVSNGETDTKRSLPPGAFSWTEPPPNSLVPENRPAGTSESFAASVPAPVEAPRESKHESGPPAGESGSVKTASRLRLAEDWLGAKPFEAVTVGGREFTFLKRQPQASDHGGIVTICRPALARDQVSNWESDVLGKSNPRVISISMTGARTLDQRDFYPKTPPEKVPSQLLGESMIVYDLHLAEPTNTPDPKLYQDPLEKV